MRLRTHLIFPLATIICITCPLQAQLFDSLGINSNGIDVGIPRPEQKVSPHGPKGIVAADFDLDGHRDVAVSNAGGSVTVLYGDGSSLRGERLDLDMGASTLRGIIAADINSDGREDIVTADPFDGKLYLFQSMGTVPRQFSESVIDTWPGARNLVSDDFDGDGNLDIVIGGRGVGLRLLKGDGNGGFTEGGDVGEVITEEQADRDNDLEDEGYALKPVFTLRSFRPAGSALPKLFATHAATTTLYVLGVNVLGELGVEGQLFAGGVDAGFNELHDFEIVPIASELTNAVPDLITVSKVSNLVTVWRGISAAPYFSQEPYQEFPISGGPRAVEVADIDGDGMGELAVVVRNFDRVDIYKNNAGLLEPLVELNTGKSPRDLVAADVNEDGSPDMVVINRRSGSVTVSMSDRLEPEGFVVPRLLYTTDGDPAGLSITDLNADGRGDILQLHRASGDVSIRLSNSDGTLSAPTYYLMGVNPNGFVVSDVNRDGIPDVSVANLGRGSIAGNLSYRIGDGSGGLGELKVITPDPPAPDPVTGARPPLNANGIFSIVQADFDGDGFTDQAVGYYDCRLSFFRGTEDGDFVPGTTTRFVYESRVMVAGDFDQDGDIDLAGAGANGDGVVLINTGEFFTDSSPQRHDFRFNKVGTRSAVLKDINDDSDPDIVLGTNDGLVALIGGEGVSFTVADLESEVLDIPRNIGAPVSSVLRGDFDGSGTSDYAIACASNSTLEVYSGNQNILSVSVPSANYVKVGDIDGDGLPDLAGTGSVLWIALSGTTPPPMPLEPTIRPKVTGVVLNEIISKNDRFRVAADNDKTSDAIEIYNSTSSPVDIQGWTLSLEKVNGETAEYTVTDTMVIPAEGRKVFVCKDKEGPQYTGYKLPSEGGRITLTDGDAAAVDEVVYPVMDTDVSMARYGDANATFYFNTFPDIGAENLDNGVLNPDLEFLHVTPFSPGPDLPLTFSVRASDDIGLASLVVYWRQLDSTDPASGEVPMYDDGMHGDGGMLDGLFAGTMEEGLPDGIEIEFYVRGVDLSDADKTIPGTPMFTFPGLPIRNYTMVVGSANSLAPGLQISEVVASSDGLVVDENGESEDWVEIRNPGETTISLDGLGLAQTTSPRSRDAFFFPPGTELAPGEYLIVWADDDLEDGPMHAPFKLSASGESVVIFGETAIGATAVVDGLSWGELDEGESLSVLGMPSDNLLRVQPPTPRAENVAGSSGIEILQVDRKTGELVIVFGTEGESGGQWLLERSGVLSTPVWQEIGRGNTNGVERIHRTRGAAASARGSEFFRVRKPPAGTGA